MNKIKLFAFIILLLGTSSYAATDVRETFVSTWTDFNVCISTGTVPTQIDTDANTLFGRSGILLQNQDDSNAIYCGPDANVSTSHGYRIAALSDHLFNIASRPYTSSTRLSVFCVTTSTTACSNVYAIQGK